MVDTKTYLDLEGLKYYHDKIDIKKADIESPDFTGTPTAPTPEATDKSKKIATTEFVCNVNSQTETQVQSLEERIKALEDKLSNEYDGDYI